MPNINLSPVQSEQAAIERRRALAAALQQQATSPIAAPQTPGAAASPYEGLANILSGVFGGLIDRKADKQQAALTDQNDRQRLMQSLMLSNAVTPQPQGLPAPMAQPQEAQIPGENAVGAQAAPPIATSLPVGPGQIQGRDASVKALAAALSSTDPAMSNAGQTLLQSLLTGTREEKARAAESAQQLASFQNQAGLQQGQQRFTAGQNTLSREAAAANQNIDPLSTEGRAAQIEIQNAKPAPGAADPYGNRTVERGGRKFIQTYLKTDPAAKTLSEVDAGPVNIPEGAKRSTDPRLADVDPKDLTEAKKEAFKVENAYVAAQRASDDLNTFVTSAKGGNKVSAAYSPVEAVLQINAGAGVKRINRQEIDQMAGAGSLFDRIAGWAGKAVSGQPIPKNIQDDMQSLSNLLSGNAKAQRDRGLQAVDKIYNSTFAAASPEVPATPKSGMVPAGIDPAVWSVMTPQERALWQK